MSTYQEVIPAVLAGEYVRPCSDFVWMKLNVDGCWECDTNMEMIILMKDYKLDTWEIKPKEMFC